MHVRWWLLLSVGILAPRSTASVAGCNTDAWRAAIGQYARGHPRAEAADLYKLAHQGIMGSEHAVKDAAAASDWMRRELVTLSKSAAAAANEDLLEPLPPDARFARVNLRPFIAAGGNPEALVRAFVATANESKGDTAQFACVERALVGMNPQQVMDSLVSLIQGHRKSGFAAMHHSRGFVEAYSPAYRVIRASLADSLQIEKGFD